MKHYVKISLGLSLLPLFLLNPTIGSVGLLSHEGVIPLFTGRCSSSFTLPRGADTWGHMSLPMGLRSSSCPMASTSGSPTGPFVFFLLPPFLLPSLHAHLAHIIPTSAMNHMLPSSWLKLTMGRCFAIAACDAPVFSSPIVASYIDFLITYPRCNTRLLNKDTVSIRMPDTQCDHPWLQRTLAPWTEH